MTVQTKTDSEELHQDLMMLIKNCKRNSISTWEK